MVLFYITNSVLDVSAGVLWWVTKNTMSGVYHGASYLYYGNSENTKDENNEENKELNEKLTKEINILMKSINEINDQIKELKK